MKTAYSTFGISFVRSRSGSSGRRLAAMGAGETLTFPEAIFFFLLHPRERPTMMICGLELFGATRNQPNHRPRRRAASPSKRPVNYRDEGEDHCLPRSITAAGDWPVSQRACSRHWRSLQISFTMMNSK
jgi:hypothetical protein